MRPLDWRQLLNEHRVPFIERGPNVKRGEINIRCPFCGSADPSYHMGLNLDSGWWSCWRNKDQHSGKSPVRLLMALLRVGYAKARELAGLGVDYVDPEGFDAIAARVLGRNLAEPLPAPARREFLAFPRDFAPIERGLRACHRHVTYLQDRGFTFVDELAQDYHLMFARSSWQWLDRVVIPYIYDRRLVTWTGRAIAPAQRRYLDLDLRESLVHPKQMLFNQDVLLSGGEVLVIVEGPFDALKLDFYGAAVGVRAVALSTNSITDEQAFMLEEAPQKFDRVLVMLDMSSSIDIVDSMRLKQQLAFIPGIEIVPVPCKRKDAGELLAKEAVSWADSVSWRR